MHYLHLRFLVQHHLLEQETKATIKLHSKDLEHALALIALTQAFI